MVAFSSSHCGRCLVAQASPEVDFPTEVEREVVVFENDATGGVRTKCVDLLACTVEPESRARFELGTRYTCFSKGLGKARCGSFEAWAFGERFEHERFELRRVEVCQPSGGCSVETMAGPSRGKIDGRCFAAIG